MSTNKDTSPKKSIMHISLVVRDYDEAIAFYTEKLGFRLIEDRDKGDNLRWVTVAPAGSDAPSLVLGKATTPEQVSFIGNQTGGRVFLFLQTDDFWQDYQNMKEKGVVFLEAPREEPYGTVAIFEDLYGNKWDLIEYK